MKTRNYVCASCGESHHYCDEDEEGYVLRCFCGEYPTGNLWLDSSGPYIEMEKLAKKQAEVTNNI